MRNRELLSSLEYLLKESKIANAKIEYSYELDRIKRRITKLEETQEKILNLIRKTYGTK